MVVDRISTYLAWFSMLLTAAMPTTEAPRYGGLQPLLFQFRQCAVATWNLGPVNYAQLD